jgi:hypothetical protein
MAVGSDWILDILKINEAESPRFGQSPLGMGRKRRGITQQSVQRRSDPEKKEEKVHFFI